jgi:hypothetical protein
MKNTQQQSTSRSSQPFDDYLYVLSEDSKLEGEGEVAEKPKVDLERQALLVRKEKFIKEISEAIKEARAPSPDSEDSPPNRR